MILATRHFAFAAFALLALTMSSDTQAARRDGRQANQRARIHQGVQSGELTSGEAHRLRRQQRHIRKLEKGAEADGTVTAGEKMRIEKAQDRASKNIYIKKHNDNERGDAAVPPAAQAPDSQ